MPDADTVWTCFCRRAVYVTDTLLWHQTQQTHETWDNNSLFGTFGHQGLINTWSDLYYGQMVAITALPALKTKQLEYKEYVRVKSLGFLLCLKAPKSNEEKQMMTLPLRGRTSTGHIEHWWGYFSSQQGDNVIVPLLCYVSHNNYKDNTIQSVLPVIISNRRDLIVSSQSGA